MLRVIFVICFVASIFNNQFAQQTERRSKMGLSVKGIVFQKTTFFALKSLAAALGGTADFVELEKPLGIQPIEFKYGERKITFVNGGEKWMRDGDSQEHTMTNPLLVIGDEFYISTADLRQVFDERISVSDSELVIGKSIVKVEFVEFSSSYFGHNIDRWAVEFKDIQLTDDVTALKSLHDNANCVLPSKTLLSVHRTGTIDGIDYFLVSKTSAPFDSYLLPSHYLKTHSKDVSPNDTELHKLRLYCRELAAKRQSISHGHRTQLENKVALSIDLCWSIRSFQQDLKSFIRHQAAFSGPFACTFFLSGRWMEQQIIEMDDLIEFSKQKGVTVSWGLHSFAHPKYGEFMNALSPDEVKRDTLKLEQLMLKWGLVPTLYYRFPGLVHDQTRLDAILDLGLISINCDSWMALVGRNQTGATQDFAESPTHGSIILVHGNGNEPQGIPPLIEWNSKNKDFTFMPIGEFLTQKGNNTP